jgi:FkbM family methyltransferase
MKKLLATDYADFSARKVHINKVPPELEKTLVALFFNNKTDGYFVDVGANDPFLNSQSFHLEQMGWRGLLIEPLPNYCDLLKKHRTNKVIMCACSSPENHLKKLPLKVADVYSTLENNLIARGKSCDEILEVETKTLNSILNENNVKVGFDLLSIDVEGHEIELFKGLSLSKWMPKLILLEDHVIDHKKHNYMINNGYQLILRTGLNSWYVPNDNHFKFSIKAKFEFFRKYWLGIITRKIRYHH